MTKLNRELFAKFYDKKNEIEKFNARRLADEFNVSPSQITKFAQKLGYSGYNELKWKTIEGKGIFNVLERILDVLKKFEVEIPKIDISKEFNNFVNYIYDNFYELLEMVQREKCNVCEIIEIFIVNVLELIIIGSKNCIVEADQMQLITCINNNLSSIKFQIQKLT